MENGVQCRSCSDDLNLNYIVMGRMMLNTLSCHSEERSDEACPEQVEGNP